MTLATHLWIGEYHLSSAPCSDPNYQDILLIHEDPSSQFHFYVNLVKDDKWKHILQLDKNNRPTEHTDPVEYQAYLDRKEMGQPLWKLSTKSLELLCLALVENSVG